MNPKERGTQYLEDFLKTLPEDIREDVKAKVLAQEAAVAHLGEHVLRQDDYSKSMNDLSDQTKANQKWHDDLKSWKSGVDRELEEGKSAIERLKSMDAGGGGRVIHSDGTPGGTGGDGGSGGEGGEGKGNGTPSGISKEDVQRLISEAVQGVSSSSFAGAAYMSRLTAQHMKEFDGDVLDTDALIAHCREKNLRVDQGGYDSFVKTRRDETSKKKHEEELKEAEDRGRAAARAELTSGPPYPISSGQGGEDAGTLSGLKLDKDAKQGAIGRAVQTYHDEQRKRLGGS